MTSQVNAFPSTIRTAAPARTEPQARSVLDNLATTNGEMLAQMERDVVSLFEHPVDSFTAMARGMILPLIHPIKTVHDMIEDIEKNPTEGLVNGASTATGLAFVGSVFIAAVATLAAPLTGGASLAIAAAAMTVGDVAGYACVASDVAGLLYHEVEGATAKTEAEARQHGQDAAGFVEDGAVLGATWVAGDALQARFFKGEAASATAMGWVANNTLGLAGKYDDPLAGMIRSGRPKVVHPKVPHPKVVPPKFDRMAISPYARAEIESRGSEGARAPGDIVRSLDAQP